LLLEEIRFGIWCLGWARGLQPLLILRSQLGVLCLEVQHHADAGQIEPGVEQVADTAQPFQVVGAVAADPALGAFRLEQSTGFGQLLHQHATSAISNL
jgi:hypothetical protein